MNKTEHTEIVKPEPFVHNKMKESKEINASIRQHQLSLDRYLVRGAKYLTPAAIICLYYHLSGGLCLILVISLLMGLKFLNDHYKIEEKLEDYKLFRKAKFVLNMKKLSKQAKSLNQTQVFLGKYLLNMPIDEDEDEIKSYNDIASHFGKDWPYMT